MILLTSVLLGLLAVSAALCLVRLLRGDSLADRIVALDTMLVVVVCGIAIGAVRSGSGIFLDVMVVASLLGFTGTALVARFIERRGAR
ncbi:monovalent cation/H+ antiporter complex subunit F [Salsipaludibacter albus]|uniref:monovalent cation/H+ antiporter complex subunit F n=1 Tax=Salsipaludibacter albus TaxID=2849650 RepID=UPI001EE498F1|nr:monovalent cation/H+ antiporter complex subunit F [Salsipaludibacter albus]MBY5162640.1 sodium:proton antiporter [Salsipaludibacter albus]